MKSSHFNNQFKLPTYNLSPQKVTKFLLLIIAGLVIFNLAEQVLFHWLNTTQGVNLRFNYFNFDHEANFPSLYSALALGFCSYLLAIIASIKTAQKARYARHWKALSLIFLFLALDEACSIHESLVPILRKVMNAGGFLYFTWVVPAFFLLIIFLLAYRKFIFNLPTKTKTLFVLAGIIYVSGALGMELISGYLAENFGFDSIYFNVAASIEELMEMFGIVIFIHGLLSYIQSYLKELHLSLSFDSSTNQ